MIGLYSGDLSPAAFLAMVENHSWPQDAILMAFTPIEARFVKFVLDPEFLSQTERGRIFSASGELHWRCLGKSLRVVYLGAPPVPENLSDHSLELNGTSSSRRQFLLWGERTDTENEWLEQQVPHRFSYPINDVQFPRGRVALVVEDLIDSSGIPRFSRYQGIIEMKGGN